MSDYSALAQRVSSSVSGIRGCLLLSRDGLVLGAHPEGAAEAETRGAWVRFASIGEPDHSFVEFPDQTWAFVRRGSYAGFVVADVGVRPGILVDLLEQALMAGEQDRALDRDTMRLPDAPSAPSGKPRTSLHKPAVSPASEPIAAEVSIRSDHPAEGIGPKRDHEDDDASFETESPSDDTAGTTSEDPDAEPVPPPPVSGADEESEVDRVLLAKEFAGLLQVPKEDDEASR